MTAAVVKLVVFLLAVVSACTPALVGGLAAQVNQERESRGLAPLRFNTQLAAVAQARAADMWENGYLSHVSPVTGEDVEVLLRRLEIPFAGSPSEVIVQLTGSFPEPGHAAFHWFMNSPPHAAVLLGRFTHMGVGYLGRTGEGIDVHLFVVVFVLR